MMKLNLMPGAGELPDTPSGCRHAPAPGHGFYAQPGKNDHDGISGIIPAGRLKVGGSLVCRSSAGLLAFAGQWRVAMGGRQRLRCRPLVQDIQPLPSTKEI